MSPSTGIGAGLNPTSITLTSGGSGTSTLTVNTSNAGNYTITVTATSGSSTHSATVVVRVFIPPDFTIASNPSTVVFLTGSARRSKQPTARNSAVTGYLTLSHTVNRM